jgi:hypothetical protein
MRQERQKIGNFNPLKHLSVDLGLQIMLIAKK